MMVHGTWKVVGKRAYLDVQPGETFDASIHEAPARRAIDRGDIVLLEEYVPCVPDERQLPEGWA